MQANRQSWSFAGAAIGVLLGVSPGVGAETTPPATLPRKPTPPVVAKPADWFADVTASAQINFVHQFCHRRIANILLSNGAGGVVFDYDNDGWMDLYLLNWGPLEEATASPPCPREPNRLFRNRGDGTFEDRTRTAGLEGTGFNSAATAGDIDNDGFTDLYIASIGRNQLYRNRGDGTFEDITGKAGVGDSRAGISAVFLDYDRDGLLDLFVANYLTYTPEKESEQNPGAYPGPLAYPGQANVLYRNQGNGSFKDVTQATGLYVPGHRAMAVSAFDCDWDGDTDLYVSNDDTPNALWINDGKGSFKNIALEAGVAFNSIGEAPGSMNSTIGDANGDGWPDLFITRLGYGSLYLRAAPGMYEDRMWSSGLGLLTQNYVGWGGMFLDYDNDGDPDLLIGNGDAFKLEGTQTLLLENRGEVKFVDASAQGGVVFKMPINARGNAVLDFDNDGRLDVVLTALADRPFLLRNRHPQPQHWLKLRLQGTRSNRNGYGARIVLKAGDWQFRAEAMCTTGFLMQSDPRVHFGLGIRTRIDRVEILWPSGQVQVLSNVAADQILTVRESP